MAGLDVVVDGVDRLVVERDPLRGHERLGADVDDRLQATGVGVTLLVALDGAGRTTLALRRLQEDLQQPLGAGPELLLGGLRDHVEDDAELLREDLELRVRSLLGTGAGAEAHLGVEDVDLVLRAVVALVATAAVGPGSGLGRGGLAGGDVGGLAVLALCHDGSILSTHTKVLWWVLASAQFLTSRSLMQSIIA